MRKNMLVGLGAISLATLAPAVARADNGTWTMPYGGSCSAGPCVNVVNETGGDVAIQGWSDQGATGVSGHSGTGYGVNGDSTSGYGVYATTGSGTAVYASAGNGTSVEGISSTGFGVIGQTSSSSTMAVMGLNYGGGYGVYGYATGGGFGVTGISATGYAVYASGKAGGTGNWVSGSDARLKKDVRDASYGLREVLRMRPVTYKLKEGDGRTHLGFIAQEVQTIVPEVVTPLGQGDLLGVEYSSLVPVLAKSIQEQQTIIERQQAQIAALERGRNPMVASLLSGGTLAMCLVPLGFVAGRRRRDEP